jgi:hypothetical protein
VAFLAQSWAGREYPNSALFTVQPLDDQPLDKSRRCRIFHGFGQPGISWGGTVYEVERERIVEVVRSRE